MTLRAKLAAGVLLFAAAAGAGACGDDDDPVVSIAVQAVSLGDGDARISVVNDGDFTGLLHGCPSGPTTAVERWSGTDWTSAFTLNDDCLAWQAVDYELAPGEEIEYTVSLPEGALYRFTLTLRVEDRFGEGTRTSNGVSL